MEADKYQKFQKELAGTVADMVKEAMGVDNIKTELEKVKEENAKMLEQNTELVKFKERMEKAEGKKVNLTTDTGETKEFIYKGFDLRHQGLKLTIADNDKRERHAKFLLDLIHDKASLSEANTGAYLVPDEYELDVAAMARLQSVALNDCRIFNVSRDVLKIPTESTGLSVDVQAFGTANTESDATLALVTLDMKRIGCYSEVYEDLMNDSFFDITSWLTELFAEALGQEIDDQVFNGTDFTGSLCGACGSHITVSGTVADLDESKLSEAISKVAGVRLNGAKFYFNKAVYHYIRTLADTQGRPIYQFPTAANPGQIYGYAATDVEKLRATATTGQYFGVFGNLRNYALGRRVGMTMKVNPYIKMKEGIVQFVAYARYDGKILLPNTLVDFAIA